MDEYKNKSLSYMAEHFPELTLHVMGVAHIIDPELQHWLQIIAWGVKYQGWKEPNINFSGANALRIGAGTPDSIILDLKTGQPATEADYQAFCNIVGI